MPVGSQAQQQLYTHAAEPKAVSQRRAKYREEDEEAVGYPANIMFDRRVVRGNTYAARILPAEATLTSEKKATGTGRKKTVRAAPPRTPQPVEGRRHMDIQTDTYLEELTDTVPEVDTQTQTDPFLDRPPTPLYIPQKTGIDAVTQIENGDLFDFDFEVEPILEVLVGKVLEQGLMEVLEEEELAAMRAHQEHFEQIRNAELVATQRMEAAEKRKIEEKERRLAQERERVERERIVRQKVAASTFARGYLSGIINTVFDELQQAGFFYDPVLREVEEAFMPWLKEQAVVFLEQGNVARQVVRKLVEAATERVAANRAEADERQRKQIEAQRRYDEAMEELSKARDARDIEAVRARPTFVLRELEPRIATEEQVEAMKAELEAAAEAEAEAAFEAAKASASEAAREKAEAQLAEQQAAVEELKQKMIEEATERGEDPPEEFPTAPEGQEPVDVEAEVAKAVEEVKKPEPKQITDSDILSAMIEKAVITKETIVQSLAINAMGDEAYYKDDAFQPQPEPEPEPVKPVRGKK